MERLLMLHLQAGACSAEVLLNGMPVAHVGADGGHACLPVHEYTLTGKNRLELIVGGAAPGQPSPSQPRVAMVPTWARARLVLARQGRSAADPDVRVLVSVEWLAPEGKSYDAPATQAKEVDLPVNFPRWRWLDAPQIDISAPVRRQVIEFLQQLALDLGRGEPDSLLTAAKLRFDELALAYQRTTSEGMQRFRDHLQQLYAAKALKLIPPNADEVVLRPVLDGRLIDCLTSSGGPALRTQNEPAQGNHAWPLRVAMVEGKIYVLR
ncbi:MAG TPA: hypothetical protein VKI18_02070 [Albitalea sp.]|nr:hypothetical protein [Albitalea sp.]